MTVFFFRFFILSSFVFTSFLWSATLLAQSSPQVSCIGQLVRANVERIQQVPDSGQTSRVQMDLNPITMVWEGTHRLDLSADRTGAKTYQLEMHVWLEPNRSVWLSSLPRLHVQTVLKDSDNKVIAMSEEHSDKVFTPRMLSWLRDDMKPRTLSKLYSTNVIEKLQSLGLSIYGMERDQSLVKAISERSLASDEAYFAESLCILETL
jgi:hypothetical protein